MACKQGIDARGIARQTARMSTTHTYKGNAPVRLNKWMAELGLCSRREAEALIEAGGVKVDDFTVERPGHKIEPGQVLSLTPRAQQAIEGKFTAVLNKPVGYVSAQPEAGQIPAVRLLKGDKASDGAAPPAQDASLAPLGRLDQDSRGLLLLSQDGVLAKAIIGPQHTLEKEYLVKVEGKISQGRLTLLRNGLVLDKRKLKPAIVTIEPEEPQVLRFILKEGRKRQIRRMCELVGLKVIDLQRLRIGPLELGDLEEGRWRALTEKERTSLIAASLGERPKRLRDEEGRPVRKGRSFVGKGGAKPNRSQSRRQEAGREETGRKEGGKPFKSKSGARPKRPNMAGKKPGPRKPRNPAS